MVKTTRTNSVHQPVNEIIKLAAMLRCQDNGRGTVAKPLRSRVSRYGLTNKDRKRPLSSNIPSIEKNIIVIGGNDNE